MIPADAGNWFTNLFSSGAQEAGANVAMGSIDPLTHQAMDAAGNIIADQGSQQALDIINMSNGINPAQIGTDAIFNPAGGANQGVQNFMNQGGNQPGMFEGFGNVMGSKGFENASKLGLGAFNAYNANEGRRDSKKFQNANLEMARDTHNRNREYDDRLANLRF